MQLWTYACEILYLLNTQSMVFPTYHQIIFGHWIVKPCLLNAKWKSSSTENEYHVAITQTGAIFEDYTLHSHAYFVLTETSLNHTTKT